MASDKFSATFAVTPLAEKYATSFLLIDLSPKNDDTGSIQHSVIQDKLKS